MEATLPPSGGILGRFENIREKESRKKMITCTAATPAYLHHDFLKPQHLPLERVDQEVNYSANSNINETRFHKGFQRRHKSDIQPDAARLEMEVQREMAQEERVRASVEATMVHRQRNTFNILTGEGSGRDCEFRQVGKKIVNPNGSMEGLFAEHSRDASNRIKSSKHRFFEPDTSPAANRTQHLFGEGLTGTSRQSAVLGYGSSGKRRTRVQSCGVADNFAHLRGVRREPDYEPPVHGNRSQILFG